MLDRVRGIRRFVIAATALFLFACMGWMISDRLERNNDFCTSCHIAPGRPLHAAIRRDFAARGPPCVAERHGLASGVVPCAGEDLLLADLEPG